MGVLRKAGEALFNAKILLFGEYSIIQNSMGLSIPYESFQGQLAFGDTSNALIKTSNKALAQYGAYLKKLQKKGKLLMDFDIEQFEQDIKKGLYFESNIPQGFGVGSSGATCAALYDRYAINKYDPNHLIGDDLMQLKKVFAQMESFHHGTSSGMDPLICYLNLPILIKSRDSIGTVDLPEASQKGQGAIFLLNTGTPGNTRPLVELFLDKCKQNEFLDLVRKSFIPYNDNCIKGFLKGETKALFYNMYFLSKFLLENLSPMIPALVRDLWKQGLDTKAYYLKLCGSGGGGYVLGFTEDLEEAKKYLKDHQIQVIKRF